MVDDYRIAVVPPLKQAVHYSDLKNTLKLHSLHI